MKIFIIGPEGSGKTVLLAMLGRYVAKERKDLVLEPVDRVASKYVIAALETLENGDWPPSTRQAELPTLRWRFGSRGAPLHEIVIFDTAGQDLRQILLAEKQESLTEEQRAIRTQIDTADVLVYLLDLNGFLGSKDLGIRDENAWLFKTFLTTPEWRSKQRLVVLSKADIYADMLATPTGQKPEDAKVRELVKQHLPENYTLVHLVDAESTVSYFAIASVETKTVIDQDGNPVRLPKNPLESAGISKLIEALIKHARWLKQKKWLEWLGKIGKYLVMVMAVLIALWFLFRIVTCLTCAGKGAVACKPCDGRGKVQITAKLPYTCLNCKGTGWTGIIFKDPCKVCKKTGQLTNTITQPAPCSACNSTGAIICPRCEGKKTVNRW